jgi:glycosyltransferase involved in cell wall biosynthesis
MRWSFQLVCRRAGDIAAVSFGRPGRKLELRIEFHGFPSTLAVSRKSRKPIHYFVRRITSGHFPVQLFVTIAAEPCGTAVMRWQGNRVPLDNPTIADLAAVDVWDEGVVIWHEQPGASADSFLSWRLQRRSSGFPADQPELERNASASARGLSFIIRAKNEAENVDRCLRSIAGLGDEIIFVDNGSSDDTLTLAQQERHSIFELKTFSYPQPLPKVGEPHAVEVRSGSRRTLGHFYNWCLAQSSRVNFAKWDADYIAIRQNLSEMIDRFDLRLRGDPFVLWFSGLELFTDGRNYWVDRDSAHSEFRVFSRKHGHRWVDIPIWEEIDQAALFMSQKLFFWKPVYVEIFRLDEVEFEDRGVFLGDQRDRARLNYLREFSRSGYVPGSFMLVEGPFDERLAGLSLSPKEVELAKISDRRLRATPALCRRATSRWLGFETARQFDFAVFIASSVRNRDRRRRIRSSWGMDLNRLGIPTYFVSGRPGQPACLIDDMLYLDIPDSFEFSAARLCEAIAFSVEFMNIDYVFKVEDDCVVNAFNLVRCCYQDAHFTAGGFMEDTAPNAARCENEQIDKLFRSPGAAPFVDGGLGYFLSHQARVLIGHNADLARRCLADGPGVTMALAAAHVEPVTPFGRYYARRWSERRAIFTDDVVILAGVPAEFAEGAYQRLVGHHAYQREREANEAQLAVNYDWADLGEVRQPVDGRSD